MDVVSKKLPRRRRELICPRLNDKWLFRNRHRDELRPISDGLYRILWVLGLVAVMVSYFELWRDDALGIQSYFVALFAFVTLFHQGVIYSDMHQLDHAPSTLVCEYRNWVNSRLERIIRVGIFIALLFGVGILGDALAPLIDRLQFSPSDNPLPGSSAAGAIALKSSIKEFLQPRGELSKSLFVKGSIVLFILLFLWNLFAIYFRLRNEDRLSVLSRFRAAGTRRRFYINEILTDLRIVLFLLLTGISTTYWFMVFHGNREGTDLLTELLIVLYIIIFGFFFALKLESIRSRLVTRLDGLAARMG